MGKQWKQWQTSFWGGSKITADGDCSHEIKKKKTLAPWKKSYDQSRQHIKKQRHFFANKGLSSQSDSFSSNPVWMWELEYKENWVPWTARKSNQFILKETSPEYSLEGLMLKLKFQYFGHLMQRVDSLEKTLMLGGIWGAGGEGDDRGWDGWMASPTQWTWVWVDSRSWWWTRRPGMLQFMGSQRVRHDWETELNWSEWNSTGRTCWASDT